MRAATQPTDSVELLMLDIAVERTLESFWTTRRLTDRQRALLCQYRTDIDRMFAASAGPAREYAAGLATIVDLALYPPYATRRTEAA